MKKALVIICCLLIVILVTTALLWQGFNSYFIPQVIIPEIKKQITIFNRDNKVDLRVQSITFLPLRGFHLVGIELKPLLTAKEIDLDLDYLALLSRQIRLPQITIIAADLKVARSARGEWNFESVIKNILKKPKKGQPLSIVIDQINVNRSQIYFDDQLFKNNRLNKHFTDVNLEIKSKDRDNYFVAASGADVKRQDAIQFKLNYSARTGLIKGEAQLKIANLSDYQDYYLDELIAPWQLAKARLAAEAEFSYCQGDFSIDGAYEIKQGQVNYGQIRLAGNGFIDHKQKYLKGKPKQSLLNAQVKISDLALQLEKNIVLEEMQAEAVITGQAVQLKRLQGISRAKPVDLKGQFVFKPLPCLDFAGQLWGAVNLFHLKLLSPNAAQIAWLASAEAYQFQVDSSVSDIKKLRFSGQVSGQVDLGLLPGSILIKADKKHLAVLLEPAKNELKGRVGFSGNLQGQLNKPETLFGKLGLKFIDFSLLDLEPLSFLLGMKVEQGVFSSGIPSMDLYQGKLFGAVVLDAKRWGLELNIKNLDLARFTRVNPQLADLKGLFTGKIAGLGNWGETSSIYGGGSFSLKNADLKNMAIFTTAQQGVGSVVKGFQLPDFKDVTGNFMITSEIVTFSGLLARAPNLELRGMGTIDFSLRANFTLGLKFIQKRDVKTALYVFFPLPTLGFDLLSKAIKVEIKGVIPNLAQTTTVQPLAWLTETSDQQSNFDPDQYTLENLWPK